MSREDVAARFIRETADHQMTVLHDDELYRHLRFRNPQSSMYWFDLITVPGSLIFRGDGESCVFARVSDMFEFFRGGEGGRINPMYWAEKLTSNRDGAMRYDPDLFRSWVTETFVERARWDGVPAGTGQRVQREVLEYAEYEPDARNALDQFEFEGFRFHDAWEASFQGYDWWFLWSLHAIVWGIAQYDGYSAGFAPSAAATEVASPASRVDTVSVTGGVL